MLLIHFLILVLGHSGEYLFLCTLPIYYVALITNFLLLSYDSVVSLALYQLSLRWIG